MNRVCCWRWGILVVAGIAFLGAFLGLSGIALGADTSAGKAVFEGNACSACHGVAGEGGLGPTLATTAFAQKYANSDKLVSMIRQGSGSMPGFTEERLSKAQMDSMVGYVMSFSQASVAKDAKAATVDNGQSAEARYMGLTFPQLWGMAILGLGAVLLLVFALFLNGPLKVRISR
jgi:mono/diheme cytochrome c family protein